MPNWRIDTSYTVYGGIYRDRIRPDSWTTKRALFSAAFTHWAPARESKDHLLSPQKTGFWAAAVRAMHLRKMIADSDAGILGALTGLLAIAQLVGGLALPDAALAVDAPEGTVKSQHGDWQVVCKDPPAGSKNPVCALVQSVTAEDKNNIGLTVYFQKFSNGTRVLRVFAPLGVLLPPGLGLKIDDKDVGHAPFLRCHSFACYAQVIVGIRSSNS